MKAPAGLWTGAGRVCRAAPREDLGRGGPHSPPPFSGSPPEEPHARLSMGRHATSCVVAPAAAGAPLLGTWPQEWHGEATTAFRMVACAVCCACGRAEEISLKRKQEPVKKARFGQPGCCWGAAPRVASLDAGLFPTFRGWCVSPSYTLSVLTKCSLTAPGQGRVWGLRALVWPQPPGEVRSRGRRQWARTRVI